MNIGVLALQGAFIEHQKMLEELNINSFQIRNIEDLDIPMDGLILPGGESTTMFHILEGQNMTEKIKNLILSGLPTFGTCAGLLLLAKKVENYQSSYLQTMDIEAKKNAYGRQLSSFKTKGIFNKTQIPFVFIRAPYILNIGKNVQVLAEHDGFIIAARENNQLVTAFHPELTNDQTVHKYFINIIKNRK